MISKKIALLAGGAILIGGALAYFSSKEKPRELREGRMDKQQLMTICKELKTQMFSASIQILEKREKVQNQIDQGASLPKNMNLEEYLCEEGDQLFLAKKKLICLKFEISLEDLRQALEEDYCNDPEVISIQEQVFQIFDNACQGIGPPLDLQQNEIDFFTKGKVLDLHLKFFTLASKKYIKAFQEFKNGEENISFENPKFLKKIRDLKIPECKRELLLSEGLDQFQTSPREIFDKITQRFKKEDPFFNLKIQDYETSFSTLIDQIAKDPFQFTESSPESIFSSL